MRESTLGFSSVIHKLNIYCTYESQQTSFKQKKNVNVSGRKYKINVGNGEMMKYNYLSKRNPSFSI
jgi:hypothetical protein